MLLFLQRGSIRSRLRLEFPVNYNPNMWLSPAFNQPLAENELFRLLVLEYEPPSLIANSESENWQGGFPRSSNSCRSDKKLPCCPRSPAQLSGLLDIGGAVGSCSMGLPAPTSCRAEQLSPICGLIILSLQADVQRNELSAGPHGEIFPIIRPRACFCCRPQAI